MLKAATQVKKERRMLKHVIAVSWCLSRIVLVLLLVLGVYAELLLNEMLIIMMWLQTATQNARVHRTLLLPQGWDLESGILTS
jgi:hypothetical protein